MSRASAGRRRPTSTTATTMISLAAWWEFHIFKTERILSMPERWAEMLPALGKNAVLHKIMKCKHDINTAAVELAKGELIWRNNSGGDKRSRTNFSTFDETAATMKAKVHFLKMLEHRLERAGSAYCDEDIDFSMALRVYIAEKEQDIKKVADSWFETSTEFRERAAAELSRREDFPGPDGNEVTEEDDLTGEEAGGEGAAADRNEEVMVTDADIEDILDTVEDEDDETDKDETAAQEDEENEDGTGNKKEAGKEEDATGNKKDNHVEADDKKVKKEETPEDKKEGEEEKEAEEEQKETLPAPIPRTTAQEQTHLHPYCLSLQDGAADLPVWLRKMRTYFALSNHSEKEPTIQKAIVMAHMDVEMGKFLAQEMESNGAEANLTNMLAAIQYILDQMYPRCTRCGETEDYQRNPHDLHNPDCLTKEMEEEEEDPEEGEKGEKAKNAEGKNEATLEKKGAKGEEKPTKTVTA